MKFKICEHGDLLEKRAAEFIAQRFYHYELVWSEFVGNKGNANIAELPGYPDEEKRKTFAENSYTVLESAFIMDQILNAGELMRAVNSFTDWMELNKSFVLFFAQLGRMHDTAKKASYALGYDNAEFLKSMHGCYEARNIVIHGRRVPFEFDELGMLKIPILQTGMKPGDAWNDKSCSWSDADGMDKQYANDSCAEFFDGLLKLINDEYAKFYDVIKKELNELRVELKFEYNEGLVIISSEPVPAASGMCYVPFDSKAAFALINQVNISSSRK